MARAKKTEVKDTVTDEQFAAEVEKMQDAMVETLPAVRAKKEEKIETPDSAIHNMKAHNLGLQWGKETVKKNGMEIKYLRKALDIINNASEAEDVVKAYKEAGGDKATASRIKKILTSALEDPACRAVVFSEESNSLQGAYQKIRDIEKQTQQLAMDDGEGELIPDRGIAGHIPAGVDLSELIRQLDEVLEQVQTFDDKATKHIKAAMKSIESLQDTINKAAKQDTDSEAWPFQRKEKFMGNAVVENAAAM